MSLSSGPALISAAGAKRRERVDAFCRLPDSTAECASRRRESQIWMALAHVIPTCRKGGECGAWTNEYLWAAELIRVPYL